MAWRKGKKEEPIIPSVSHLSAPPVEVPPPAHTEIAALDSLVAQKRKAILDMQEELKVLLYNRDWLLENPQAPTIFRQLLECGAFKLVTPA